MHTQHGLQITIPDEKWINWKTFSLNSQKEFMRVAWAQLTQFDKIAFMTGLKDGRFDPLNIYLDFDEDAQHDQFWNTELDSVRRFYIELVTSLGSFHFFNNTVIQDLAYFNEPHNILPSID